MSLLPQWIIKGKVLTGPHPGQISTAEMVKHLTSILSEGASRRATKGAARAQVLRV